MTLGVAVATIIVPILIIFLALLFRPNSKVTRSFSIFLMIAVAYGILIRLAIAPLTGHPQDLENWTYPIKLFYESGVADIRLYPLPLTYYPVLLAYSPYALLRILGFQDITFLAHRIGMVESVFIKAPFLLSDIFSLYFLYKILNRFGFNIVDRPKGLAYALVYFLGPVVILSSSAWPLCDGIAVALFLAGIYYAMLDGQPLRGALFYTLSGLTKAFGFLGLVPLSIDLVRKKKFSMLLVIFGMIPAIASLLYLPLFNVGGIQGIPEFFMQFLRARAGFGSQGSFIASDSYISYLSLVGYSVEPSYLSYLFVVLFALITVFYALKVRRLDVEFQNAEIIDLSLQYFATFFFVFYLTFFRVYAYYYLWVIPVLIMYSYRKRASGPLLAAVFLSLVAAPIVLLGVLVSGSDYFWISLSMPADTSIMSVIPSTIVALAFLSILDARGPAKILRSNLHMSISAGILTWFSFGIAYYAYYGVPFLGTLWYAISLVVASMGAVFFIKVFRRL